ncbi:UDP-N-acetylglucosamine 2-epimerase [Pelagibacteraceae bacterium]|nr:UDP-N-acetylglucosamine 2-epimerase [Pelagibacteraceae bacterium]
MKVFLVTSTRADFGLLKNLIYELKKNVYFNLKIIATGTHFSKKYGLSFKEIKSEKIKIHKKILINCNTNSPKLILKDMSILSQSISSIITKEKPDLFIVLGDRYEICAVSLSAYINKTPIAHIHGGEVTSGSLDDGFRHCVSKMSNFHFVSHESYKKRLMQLGESPKTIYDVGALGVENIYKTNFLSKNQLEKLCKINLKKSILLVCLQPEITKQLTVDLVNETLKALKNYTDKSIIFTMPGADLYNDIIFKKIQTFTRKNRNCLLFETLGSKRFLSFLKIADMIIGNSSSGILEMPTFNKPTINIGDRQLGRIKSRSIIDVSPNAFLIKKKIDSIYFKKIKILNSKNIYKKPNTSKKIVSIIRSLNLKKIKQKKFYDIKF